MGSGQQCSQLRQQANHCNPLLFERLGGISKEYTLPNSFWEDELAFDDPFLFVYDISTHNL